MSVILLSGGVGGAKLALGLARVLPPGELTVLVNTGDDFEHLGLPVCPDLDTLLYTLGGRVHPSQGWGRADESWGVLDEIRRLGGPDWFLLGDRDIALHLLRQDRLRRGMRLTQVAAELAKLFGIDQILLPMADQPVRTFVDTSEGRLAFQHYFVARRCEPRVTGFSFAGASEATPSPELMSALADPGLRGILIAPSNPYLSIAPILAVPGLEQSLIERQVPILAVSPIVDGKALKGPAAKIMNELGQEASSLSVARTYSGFADALLLDSSDADLADDFDATMPRCFIAPTVMVDLADREALARHCLKLLESLPKPARSAARRA